METTPATTADSTTAAAVAENSSCTAFGRPSKPPPLPTIRSWWHLACSVASAVSPTHLDRILQAYFGAAS
jgi:hypothetical protein